MIEISMESSDKTKKWSADKAAVVEATWVSLSVTGVVGLIVSFYFYT
jgi:hypothetical protein